MIVMKFGGTSVGSVAAFNQVIEIVANAVTPQYDATGSGVVVITSAMSGTTNTLIEAAEKAANGDNAFWDSAQGALWEKHHAILDHFVYDQTERDAVIQILDRRLQEFARLCSSIAVLGELTARSLDIVSGLGERMSAPLLAAVLRGQRIPARFIDATALVITDKVHGGAEPLMNVTTERCRAHLLPMLTEGAVPIVTGFVGRTEDGIPTTLGRGGSDYSAAIIGAALGADEIQIWTDVDGVLTADPRMIDKARSLNQLSYKEMAELAYYGAKVLHPKAVKPAIERKIPLRVLNTFNPRHEGTRIVEDRMCLRDGGVKAIATIRHLNLITVAGRDMMEVPGMTARTFASVARVNANVLMICHGSNEQNICFVVPAPIAGRVVDALNEEFDSEIERGYIDKVAGTCGIAIVGVVGSGMHGVPSWAAQIYEAIGRKQINVIATAQGTSQTNVSLILEEDETFKAVTAIHDIFELDRVSGD